MVLEELQEKQLVHIEIKLDREKYEIVTQVIGASEDSVLVDPVLYRDEIIPFSSKGMKTAVLNLYGDDPEGKRVGWLNVSIEVKEYKSHHYYIIHTKKFNRHSITTDRRKNDRVNLRQLNALLLTENGKQIQVQLHDISANGVSFYTKTTNHLGKVFTIQFDDYAHDETFHIRIKCQFVRRQEDEQGQLFGCSIIESNKRLLSYLFWKPLMPESVSKLIGYQTKHS